VLLVVVGFAIINSKGDYFMKKKIFYLAVATLLTIGLAGCGTKEGKSASSSSSNKKTSQVVKNKKTSRKKMHKVKAKVNKQLLMIMMDTAKQVSGMLPRINS